MDAERNKIVGLRVRKLRTHLGKTQQEFSNISGVDRGYLAAIEIGTKYPSSNFLSCLIGTTGVNANWLLSGEGEMFTEHPTPKELSLPAVPSDVWEAINADPMLASIVRMLADMPEEKKRAAFDYISEKKHLTDLEKAVEELKAKAG